MTHTPQYYAGDIVFAPCYFYDKEDHIYKIQENARPFLIDRIEDDIVTMRSISTKKHEYSHEIKNLGMTGLKKQSYVHCTKYNIDTFALNEIVEKKGRLASADHYEAELKVQQYHEYQTKKILKSKLTKTKEQQQAREKARLEKQRSIERSKSLQNNEIEVNHELEL